MLCPICKTELRMTERSGIEIDYCPQCRGVWLDRGELDKLIERSRTEVDRYDDDDDDDRRRGYGAPPPQQQHYPKKRESFWSNLFDFD